MISLIKGTIVETGTRSMVVLVNGLGYKVNVTEDTLHTVKIGQEITLFTHLAIREDAQDLYGFPARKDRDFFELLITISGIGPKSALNILSLIASDTLVNAIRSGSTAHLVKVSGIGRKTAEKIVMELKDKLAPFAGNYDAGMTAEMSSDADVIEALKALGYDADEAREALKKVGKEITETSAKVKAALKTLGNNK